MIISNGWHTKKVDYTNEFAQDEIYEEAYIEQLRSFGRADGIIKVFQLLKSLYGLKQSANYFMTS